MMGAFEFLAMVCLGFAGGIVSTIAGGASIVTFPALVSFGLSPIVSNATNAVALSPSSFAAVYADRSRLPSFDATMKRLMAAMTVGTFAGAGLLLATPSATFALATPALLGLATLLYALGPTIHAMRAARGRGEPTSSPTAFLLLGIYCGYFGSGTGVILLALLRMAGEEDFVRANIVKNVFGCLISAALILFFALSPLVSWPHAIGMIVGNWIGGFAGAALARVVPPAALRLTILVMGAAMTLRFAWTLWLRPLGLV